jgi:hypothetical protein
VPGEHRNLFPSNRAEDEAFEAASYQGLGDIFSGDGDDLPPPYPQSVTSLLLPVKKEVEESSNQQPIQDDDDAIPKKKARKKAVVACNFCQSVFKKFLHPTSLSDHHMHILIGHFPKNREETSL